MAVLTRTNQTADFVSRSDPAADQAGKPGPDPDWLMAAGQPEGCTRFTVRPLSKDEYRACVAAGDAGTVEDFERALCQHGWVGEDGQKPDLDRLAVGWIRVVANLVAGVTTRPLDGLLSRSAALARATGERSTDESAGDSSPK